MEDISLVLHLPVSRADPESKNKLVTYASVLETVCKDRRLRIEMNVDGISGNASPCSLLEKNSLLLFYPYLKIFSVVILFM
jgi:hypothetical protein